MTVSEKIVLGIVSMRQMRIKYKRDNETTSEEYDCIHPHLLGINKSTGNYVLSAYYVPATEEVAPSWKTFLLESIVDAELLNEKFIRANGYNPKDTRMSSILCNIQ